MNTWILTQEHLDCNWIGRAKLRVVRTELRAGLPKPYELCMTPKHHLRERELPLIQGELDKVQKILVCVVIDSVAVQMIERLPLIGI